MDTQASIATNPPRLWSRHLSAARRRHVEPPALNPHRSFDPVALGELETDAWVHYYRREWISFARSAVTLSRRVFALSWPATIRCSWLVLRATQRWAPYPDNDAAGAQRAMERFYRVIREQSGDAFEPTRAAALEVEWWHIHRVNQHDVTGGDDGRSPARSPGSMHTSTAIAQAELSSRRAAARPRDAPFRSVGAAGLPARQPADRARALRADRLLHERCCRRSAGRRSPRAL